jgi:hypothetical protein
MVEMIGNAGNGPAKVAHPLPMKFRVVFDFTIYLLIRQQSRLFFFIIAI